MTPPVAARSRLSHLRAVRGAALGNSALYRLELSLVPFNLAEFGTWVAILVYAYGIGGTAASGIVGFLLLVPAALIAPFAPSLCTRLFRGRALLAGYLAQSAAYALTGAAMMLGLPVALVIVLAAAGAIALTSTRPLIAAGLPSAAQTPGELTRASLVMGWVESFGIVAGPAIAGLILLGAGPGAVYGAMAAGLAVSALVVADVGRDRTRGKESVLSVTVGLRAGLHALAGDRGTATVAAFMGVHYLVLGAIDVLLVALAFRLLHVGQAGLGLLTTAFGIGSIIGASIGLALASGQRLTRGLVAGTAAWGLGLVLISVLSGRVSAVLLVVLAGMGRPLITMSGRLLLQRVAAAAALIPLFAVLEGLSMGAMGLGLACMAPVIGQLGDRQSFVLVGLTLPILLIAFFRQFTALEHRGILPEERLFLLRSVPMFRPVSLVTIDRLARNLVPIEVAPGEAVVRQGKSGNLFYIVASGRLTVDVDGQPVRTVGEAGHFGEIALLREGIRTATVTADLPTRLYALNRHHFLAAISGHAESASLANAVVESRLEGA